jgi:hypothetical protein
MDMHGQNDMHQNDMQESAMDHSMAQDDCECPEQCKVSCASTHISLGMNSVMPFANITSSFTVPALATSAYGINHLTELRPPIA